MSRAADKVDAIAHAFDRQLEASQAADRQRSRLAPHLRLGRAMGPSLHPGGVRTVCLVGCSKIKGAEMGLARYVYRSPLFEKSVELAELVGDQTFIVSAAKGLIGLDTPITPYDLSLGDKPKAWRAQWGREVVAELEGHALGTPTPFRVVILAGEKYAVPIVEAIAERRAVFSGRFVPPIDLMKGLQIGDRLAFLNRAIAIARKVGS